MATIYGNQNKWYITLYHRKYVAISHQSTILTTKRTDQWAEANVIPDKKKYAAERNTTPDL